MVNNSVQFTVPCISERYLPCLIKQSERIYHEKINIFYLEGQETGHSVIEVEQVKIEHNTIVQTMLD